LTFSPLETTFQQTPSKPYVTRDPTHFGLLSAQKEQEKINQEIEESINAQSLTQVQYCFRPAIKEQ
jgi:hypothetical protein